MAGPERTVDATSNEPTAAIDDIRRDLQLLRDDVSRLAQQISSLTSTASGDAGDEAGAQLRQIREKIDELVSATGREAADAVRAATDNLSDSLEKALRERPFTTLAMAVGLGFIFGATWRR